MQVVVGSIGVDPIQPAREDQKAAAAHIHPEMLPV
jgi:hypothetical protein